MATLHVPFYRTPFVMSKYVSCGWLGCMFLCLSAHSHPVGLPRPGAEEVRGAPEVPRQAHRRRSTGAPPARGARRPAFLHQAVHPHMRPARCISSQIGGTMPNRGIANSFGARTRAGVSFFGKGFPTSQITEGKMSFELFCSLWHVKACSQVCASPERNRFQRW